MTDMATNETSATGGAWPWPELQRSARGRAAMAEHARRSQNPHRGRPGWPRQVLSESIQLLVARLRQQATGGIS